MAFNILGTPQPRKSRIVPGLVKELNEYYSKPENQEKKNQSLEQKTSEVSKGIISDINDICRGYEEFMGWEDRGGKIPTQITDKYSPTKQQVLDFSKSLINYKDLRYFISDSSNYLTALMHSSNEKEFEIDLQELNNDDILLDDLGYRLEDEILVVNGNAGNYVGYYAKNSKITINGSAGNFVGGYAKNCEIYVKGNIRSISEDRVNSKIFQFKNNKWVEVGG